MTDFENILRSIQPYAIAIAFAAVYLAEQVLPQRKGFSDIKHDLFNIIIGVFNVAIAVIGGYFLQEWLVYTGKKNFGLLNLLPDILWVKVTLGFILLDLFMYWWHRANHELFFLWRFHKFHHKDEKLNSTSAIRFHSVELIYSYVVRFCLFPLLGLQVVTVVLYATLLFPIIVFHHSNVRIGTKMDFLCRNFFVTPLMHRIHHSKIVHETNSNYGSIFPYWDSLFRSYKSKPVKEIEFGVD